MEEIERRRSKRRCTNDEVRCLTSNGPLPEVWLVDLSTSGCQVVMRNGILRLGQSLLIRPESIEALAGTVRWINKDRAGIEFAFALHPSVFDHLLKAKVDPTHVAHFKDEQFQDRFGRAMPPLKPLGIQRSVA